MKGILAEPGKDPVIASLPDSLWAIENRLGTPCEMIVLPRTPVMPFSRPVTMVPSSPPVCSTGSTEAASFTGPSSATDGRVITSSP